MSYRFPISRMFDRRWIDSAVAWCMQDHLCGFLKEYVHVSLNQKTFGSNKRALNTCSIPLQLGKALLLLFFTTAHNWLWPCLEALTLSTSFCNSEVHTLNTSENSWVLTSFLLQLYTASAFHSVIAMNYLVNISCMKGAKFVLC